MELTIHIKIDLALNNLQRLIRHKTQTTNRSVEDLIFFADIFLILVRGIYDI